jgi:hypothetical protein
MFERLAVWGICTEAVENHGLEKQGPMPPFDRTDRSGRSGLSELLDKRTPLRRN